MLTDPKFIKALVDAGTLAFTILAGFIGAIWALVRYFDQRQQDRAQRAKADKDRLDQQRLDEEGRRAERVANLLAAFNQAPDAEKKTWIILALSLYPKETGRLLTMSLGRFDEEISKSVLLALVSMGPEVLPELIRLNRIAQVFEAETSNTILQAGDIYDGERLAARTKVAIQNLLIQADGGSTQQYDLADVDLSKCIFLGLKLQGANFRKCNLRGAVLKQARIREGNFRGAVLEGAVFTDAHLQGCDLTGAKGPLQAVHLVLKKGTFDHADLDHSHFDGAHLEAATFLKASLVQAELPGLHVTGCRFDQSDLRKVHAPKSHWVESEFRHAKLTASDLSEAEWSHDRFEDCELMGLNGQAAVVQKTAFLRCDFGGSRWPSATFTDATFEGCRFGGADFRTCAFIHPTFIDCVIDTGLFDLDVASLNRTHPGRRKTGSHPH
ncbi:hypothetical protein GETHLI_17990 [Geothrix limicola]|uniref:Pentapeptide repeat-containing protein n=1 Tax=Geothrix limicola TaxID=2927978 RepID=A0ABQ5QEN2_9BACT|nr:pentapeptide repeat-containing protein [Geothrix limicola]GLH73297.1 hypothetical protein GETHLI_17990 [Geothrix limicola]